MSLGSLFCITRQSLVMPKQCPLEKICLSVPHTHVRFLYYVLLNSIDRLQLDYPRYLVLIMMEYSDVDLHVHIVLMRNDEYLTCKRTGISCLPMEAWLLEVCIESMSMY